MTDEAVLVIRADASVEIGAGHVMRCLALAQAWQNAGGMAAFVCREVPESLRQRLESEAMSVRMIDVERGSAADSRMLVEILRHQHAAAVVIDGYAFDAVYQRVVADSDCVTIVIDDHADADEYPVDLVLNQNAGVRTTDYARGGSGPDLLLGPRYALLRREFAEADADGHGAESSGPQVLVTLGGSDPQNTSAIVIAGLQRLADPELRVRVIVGGLNQFADSIQEQCGGDQRFSVFSDVRDMSTHFRWARLAVTAGGSSNWEMCPAGLPRMMVVIADNQRVVADYLDEAGVGVSLGDAADLTAVRVQAVAESLLQDSAWLERAATTARRLVDGQGARRCVDRIRQKVESRSVRYETAPDQ